MVPGERGAERDLAAVLADFASVVAEREGVRGVLDRLGRYCAELLPVDGAGVLLRGEDGHLHFATGSDDEGIEVELLEVELREGPSTDAYREGRQVEVVDLEQAHDRYPRFAPRALDVGIRSVHAFPMTLRGQRLGTLDLISLRPCDLPGADAAAAQLLADVSMAYIVNAQAFDESSRLAEQLQRALDSRVLIEQAKGKLSERLGVGVGEAFEKLRSYARRNGRRLHHVAEEVLDGRLELR